MTIRPAEEKDDSRVGDLLVESFLSAYSKKKPDFLVPESRKSELRAVKERRSSGLVLVGEVDGKLIGTVTVYKQGTESCDAWLPEYAELRFLAVDSEFHGSGLGVPLLNAAQSACREWGSHGISIRVRQGLNRLVLFYESHGFKRDSRGDQIYSPGIALDGYSFDF